MKCTLCLSLDTEQKYQITDHPLGSREYWQCCCCKLIFLPSEYRLSRQEEKNRYDLHDNRADDENYVGFLNKLAIPLKEKLKEGYLGLDFGCGPGPTLSDILTKEGYSVKNYDPLYFPDEGLLGEKYDFITCTETVEHFFDPHKEFILFDQMMRSNESYLAIMTGILENEGEFIDWWYHKDPTHVSFYQKDTLAWISNWRNWNMELPAKNVVIFSKKV